MQLRRMSNWTILEEKREKVECWTVCKILNETHQNQFIRHHITGRPAKCQTSIVIRVRILRVNYCQNTDRSNTFEEMFKLIRNFNIVNGLKNNNLAWRSFSDASLPPPPRAEKCKFHHNINGCVNARTLRLICVEMYSRYKFSRAVRKSWGWTATKRLRR